MLKRRSIQLAIAFAGLLAIIGGAALAIRHGAATAQREVADLHQAHFEAGEALASIRADVFLAGILTRDYLLDPEPRDAAKYAIQFASVRGETERSFQTLARSGGSAEEKQALAHLHDEVNAYWDPTKVVLEWTPAQKEAMRGEFLQDRVRHREEIVELAGKVEGLMAANFSAVGSRITTANERFESWLAWTTGIALLLAFGIAGSTIARMVSLERKSATAETEMRRLSGQIRMAQEQERRYLSRELHDQAGQMLTGLRMELASISHGAGEEEVSERVAHAKEIVEQTLRVIRNIAMLLRPSMLDDLGLVSAIGCLVRDVTRSSGIEIHPEIDPEIDALPDAQCTCAYRVIQEALTNAARHSGARRVDVSLSATDGGVFGAVTDDGHGFNTASVKYTGLGLAGMGERLHELGGVLRIVSSPGQGARVEFRLPRPEMAENEYAGGVTASGSADAGASKAIGA